MKAVEQENRVLALRLADEQKRARLAEEVAVGWKEKYLALKDEVASLMGGH